VFFARVHCPVCRSEHEWFAGDAWVCEGGEARLAEVVISAEEAA
jgi:hypothetical protein